jgi:hypothetical protein
MLSVRKGFKTLFTMARSTSRQDVQKADLSEEGLGEADVGEAGEKDATAMYLRTTLGQVGLITSTGWEKECPTCCFDSSRKNRTHANLRRRLYQDRTALRKDFLQR